MDESRLSGARFGLHRTQFEILLMIIGTASIHGRRAVFRREPQ